jgi:hypothetical protein
MTTRDDDETPRDAPRSARFGVARAHVERGATRDGAATARVNARALEEHRGVDDVRPGLALAFDGASGGAFGTTTTTRERGDVDAFDAAIELRYDVDASFDARIEARVVRNDGERVAREVHLGRLGERGGGKGVARAPKRARSAAIDRAVALEGGIRGNWTESLIFSVDPVGDGENEGFGNASTVVRGTVYEAVVVSAYDDDDDASAGYFFASGNDTTAAEEAEAYARAVETMTEVIREARASAVIDPGDDASAPIAVVWSTIGTLAALLSFVSCFACARRRRARRRALELATATEKKVDDEPAPKIETSAREVRRRRTPVKSPTPPPNRFVASNRASNAPIFPHTNALTRNVVSRLDSLGVATAGLRNDSLLDVDDGVDEHLALDVNRTQDSEEFHQHAVDIRDRTRDGEGAFDDDAEDENDDDDQSRSGSEISAIFASAIDEDDEAVELTAAEFAHEIAQSLDVDDTSFAFITSDEFERYVQVFEKLGSGGHSTVYSAKWNERQVALKIMHDESDRMTLQSEIEIMRAVNHPSIVKIYGACSSPMCLMLQIVHGGSLHEVLHCSTAAEAPLAETQTLRIARDISSAMTYLHELNPKIIHRDLKPQNVLIEQDTLRALLSDFGVSRAVRTSLSPSSLGAGTVNYMAPELFDDGRADEKVDVYSFAMILCETLSGKQPWKGIQPVRIASTILGDSEATSRPPLPPNVSEFTTELIRACWHRDSERRPAFREILTALDRHISDA